MSKQNKNKLIIEEIVVTRGKGVGRKAKWVKGISCVVMHSNQTYSGEHYLVYTNTELQCYTLETYIIFHTNFTTIK